MQKLQNNTLSIGQKIKQQTNLLLSLWISWFLLQISQLQSWEIMKNAEFTNLTQTTNFYTQDLFQSTFLTCMQHQITHKCIKTQ